MKYSEFSTKEDSPYQRDASPLLEIKQLLLEKGELNSYNFLSLSQVPITPATSIEPANDTLKILQEEQCVYSKHGETLLFLTLFIKQKQYLVLLVIHRKFLNDDILQFAFIYFHLF